jgi:hypothetical protein
MLKWITCYLSGNHDFQIAREPGAIFLRCNHCGSRSNGWELEHERTLQAARAALPQPMQLRSGTTTASALR